MGFKLVIQAATATIRRGRLPDAQVVSIGHPLHGHREGAGDRAGHELRLERGTRARDIETEDLEGGAEGIERVERHSEHGQTGEETGERLRPRGRRRAAAARR